MIKLTAKSGYIYEFTIFQLNSAYIPKHAGIYLFLRDNKVLYIGETENFYDRIYINLEQHQAWKCVSRNYVNQVAIFYTYGNEQQRINIETDLRHNNSTPCNLQ